jgi:effector-binding domain-containing protein
MVPYRRALSVAVGLAVVLAAGSIAGVSLFGGLVPESQAQATEQPPTTSAEQPKTEAQPFVNQIGEIRADSIWAMSVLVLPMRGSYDQHPAAIMKLVTYAGPKGIMRSMPFGIYYDDPTKVPADSLRWDICVPVAADTQTEAPFEVRTLPAMFAAEVVCTGPYEGTAVCYAALMEWVGKNGYVISGPCQEHWLGDPMTMPPEKLESRIIFPVSKK